MADHRAGAGVVFARKDEEMEDRWLSVDEIAEYLGVAKDTVYTWVTGKGMPGHKDMSVQGNIKPLRSLTEPLQVAMDNGAKRALIPIENKRNFLDVSADIMEHVDPIFFGDPKTAAIKVLGLV